MQKTTMTSKVKMAVSGSKFTHIGIQETGHNGSTHYYLRIAGAVSDVFPQGLHTGNREGYATLREAVSAAEKHDQYLDGLIAEHAHHILRHGGQS